MLFSTKAEYGVRLMVEPVASNTGPVSLNAIAEAERLPLLSGAPGGEASPGRSGHFDPQRHGGYSLAYPARKSPWSRW